VCTQAGNVNTGSFDPIERICAEARNDGAWVHVDGAFGLWAAASSRYRHLTAGISQADSWATDAHKWLNVPQDCGIALVRYEASLKSAMSVNAPYLVPGGRRDPAQYGPELSRRARGIELWAALRHLGRDGVSDLIDSTCAHAQWLAEQLRLAGFDVLNDVVLNQVLVALGDEDLTARTIERIQTDGECWMGGTVWRGLPALRVSVSGWATTRTDMERALAAIVAARQACRGDGP
ncbi:MAG: pyridoxal-dependent decarboxylase, partial [Pseudomonadota bacterium]|nr:pyridoxal-dependent decarboxylase [Pseudomonadota bacterium]